MRGSRLFPRVLLMVVAIVAGGCDGTPTAPGPGTQSGTLSQFSVTPATVDAGATSEGTVTLAARAPASGTVVRLSSSDGVAEVPVFILVPAGAASASITITTRLVAHDTTATISALLGADKRDAVLRVMAPPTTLQALEVQPAELKGGQSAQGTIWVSGFARAPMTFTVRSGNSAATVPPTVTMVTGAFSATFTVTTRPVTMETVFDITANLGDQSRSAQMRLTP